MSSDNTSWIKASLYLQKESWSNHGLEEIALLILGFVDHFLIRCMEAARLWGSAHDSWVIIIKHNHDLCL
jgi:hypothetical protein